MVVEVGVDDVEIILVNVLYCCFMVVELKEIVGECVFCLFFL